MRVGVSGLALALLAVSLIGSEASQLILNGPECSATQSVWAMVCNSKAVIANGITFKPYAYLGSSKVEHAYYDTPVYNAGPYSELMKHECSATNISLTIPVGAPGYYKLEIYEVEALHRTRAPSGCPRVFSICAEDHMIAAGTCLFDYPGVDHATTFTQQFYVDDGAVNVQLFASTGTAKLAGLVVTRLDCKKNATTLGRVSGTCRAGTSTPPAVPPTRVLPSPVKAKPKASPKRRPSTKVSPKPGAPPKKSTAPPPAKATPSTTPPASAPASAPAPLPLLNGSVTAAFPPAGTLGATPASHTLTLLPATATATLTPSTAAPATPSRALLATAAPAAASPDDATGPPDNITWPGANPPAGPATLTLTYPLPLSVASLTVIGAFPANSTANLTIDLLDPSGNATRIYAAPPPAGTSLTAAPRLPVPLVSAVRLTAADPSKVQIDTVQLSGTLDPAATVITGCNLPAGTLLQWAAAASDPSLDPPTPVGAETNAVGRPDGKFWAPATRPANLSLTLTYPTTVAPTYVLLYGTFPPNATLTIQALPAHDASAADVPSTPVTLFSGAPPAPTPGAPGLRWLPIPLHTNPTYTTTALRLITEPSQVALDAALLVGYPHSQNCTTVPTPFAPALLSHPTTPAPLATVWAVRALGSSGPFPPTTAAPATTVNPTLVTGPPDARAAALPATPSPTPYLALYYPDPTVPTALSVRGRTLPTAAAAPTLTAVLIDAANATHVLPPADLPPPTADYTWLNFTIPANSTLDGLNISRVLLLPSPPDAWETDAAALTGANASLVLPPAAHGASRGLATSKDRSFRDKLAINGDHGAGLALFIAGVVLIAVLLCAAAACLAWRTGRSTRADPSAPPTAKAPGAPANGQHSTPHSQQQHNFSCFPGSALPKGASRSVRRTGSGASPAVTPPAAAAAALAALPAPRRKYWLFGPYVWPTATSASSTTASISNKSPRSWHPRGRRASGGPAASPPRGVGRAAAAPPAAGVDASPGKAPAAPAVRAAAEVALPRPPPAATMAATAPPAGLMLPPRGAARSVELTMSEANVVATSTPGSQMVDARAAAAWSSWSRENPTAAAALVTNDTDLGRSRTSDVTVTMSEQQYIAYQAFLDACRRVS